MRPISFVVAGGDLSWLIRACLVESDAKLSPYPLSHTNTHTPTCPQWGFHENLPRGLRTQPRLRAGWPGKESQRSCFLFLSVKSQVKPFFHKVLHSGFRCQTLPSAPSLARTCLCVSYLDASALALNDFNIKRKWQTFNICIPTHGRPRREALFEHLKGNNHEHIP